MSSPAVNEHAMECATGAEARCRILVLFGSIPLFGHERANISVLASLKELGVRSLFLTDEQWGGVHVNPYLERLGLEWAGASYVVRFRRGMGVAEWMRAFGRMLRGNCTILRALGRFRPTHIYVANETYAANMLPALLLTRLPVIYRIGDAPQQHRLAFRLLWRVLGARASAFVCVSRFILERAVAAGVPRAKLRVIYSCPLARDTSEDERGAVPAIWPEGFTVAYAGQLSADKGVDVLVQAAVSLCSRRSDIRFLIAGDYSWKNPFAQELMGRVAAAGVADRVRFLGTIQAAATLFASSDLHVCPSVWQEPLANVVLEAKAAGRASVVFPVGGLPEVVEHMVDGYVCEAPTAEALAKAIELFAGDRALTRRLGTNARAAFEGKYGLQRFTTEWSDVLRFAAGAH